MTSYFRNLTAAMGRGTAAAANPSPSNYEPMQQQDFNQAGMQQGFNQAGMQQGLNQAAGHFQQASDAMSQHARFLGAAAQGGLARAQEAAHGQYQQLAPALAAYVKERVPVSDYANAGFGAVGERLHQRRMDARKALFEMSNPLRARLMLGTRDILKSSLVADPDMWDCAKRNIEALVDSFWDDLIVYVETAVDDTKMAAIGRAETDVERLGALGDQPRGPIECMRAFFLYHLLPFDRSIFWQFKDPVFWLFTVISLCTFYGIRVIFFAFELVMIVIKPPPDEYQMVQYIIAFKGIQFISSGVCMAIFATVKYYMCIKPHGIHTCDVDGPGATQDVLSGAIDIIGSCVLVWIAFLCLPCSTRSAGLKDCQVAPGVPGERSNEEVATGIGCCRGDQERGGRLARLLGYDFCCFLVSVGFLVFLTYWSVEQEKAGDIRQLLDFNSTLLNQTAGNSTLVNQPDTTTTTIATTIATTTTTIASTLLNQAGTNGTVVNQEVQLMLQQTAGWQFRTAIFFARVFYSFLAFPFVFFAIPGLNGILTHTTATGYNRNGLCVPYYLHPVVEDPHKSN